MSELWVCVQKDLDSAPGIYKSMEMDEPPKSWKSTAV